MVYENEKLEALDKYIRELLARRLKTMSIYELREFQWYFDEVNAELKKVKVKNG